MNRSSHQLSLDDTIAATATAPGDGGIAIIRISGSKARLIVCSLCSLSVESFVSHQARLVQLFDENKEKIDKVLLLPMLGSRSYTGEETVEIHCHGGQIASRRILTSLLFFGARLAEAGEFTKRAFLNGKLDLTQAEAVQKLIQAKSERSFEAASRQLEGQLSSLVQDFQKRLTEFSAILEAWVDFPEEDLEFLSFEELQSALASIIADMKKLIESYHEGKLLHDGICLSLLGLPNVGKSTLMNALLGFDRAIVTDIPGTTRDLLEDYLTIAGYQIQLSDTAGLRDSEDPIERLGVERSYHSVKKADLVLFVLDCSRPLEEKEKELLKSLDPQKTLVVWNKLDEERRENTSLAFPHELALSAREKIGLEALKEKILAMIFSQKSLDKTECVLTDARHKEALSLSCKACEAVLKGLEENISAEFLALDIRHALHFLARIIGRDVGEDVLSEIFSRFCIGK